MGAVQSVARSRHRLSSPLQQSPFPWDDQRPMPVSASALLEAVGAVVETAVAGVAAMDTKCELQPVLLPAWPLKKRQIFLAEDLD